MNNASIWRMVEISGFCSWDRLPSAKPGRLSEFDYGWPRGRTTRHALRSSWTVSGQPQRIRAKLERHMHSTKHQHHFSKAVRPYGISLDRLHRPSANCTIRTHCPSSSLPPSTPEVNRLDHLRWRAAEPPSASGCCPRISLIKHAGETIRMPRNSSRSRRCLSPDTTISALAARAASRTASSSGSSLTTATDSAGETSTNV